MKRSIVLLIGFTMLSLIAVGYPNSHVTKETPTYQEAVKIDAVNYDVVTLTSVDVEATESFTLSSPWLGYSNTMFTRRAAKDSNGYASDVRKPPRYRCQKLGFTDINIPSAF